MNPNNPKELQEYLQTHKPNRAERRRLEAMYRKQQRDIKSGKISGEKKPALHHIYTDPDINAAWKKLPWWKRIFKFWKLLLFRR